MTCQGNQMAIKKLIGCDSVKEANSKAQHLVNIGFRAGGMPVQRVSGQRPYMMYWRAAHGGLTYVGIRVDSQFELSGGAVDIDDAAGFESVDEARKAAELLGYTGDYMEFGTGEGQASLFDSNGDV